MNDMMRKLLANRVRGWQWLDTANYRRRLPVPCIRPSEWAALYDREAMESAFAAGRAAGMEEAATIAQNLNRANQWASGTASWERGTIEAAQAIREAAK